MQQKTKYQTKMRIKKGDEVIVLSGKWVGKTGKVESVDKKHSRVYVTKINIAKRHTRPNSSNQVGGIIEKVMPLHVSKVALIDTKTKKPTRISYKMENDKKLRVAKRSGNIIS